MKYQKAIDEFKASMDDTISELPDEPPNKSTNSYVDDNSDLGENGTIRSISIDNQVYSKLTFRLSSIQKDLFTKLSSRRLASDRSTCCNVSSIRFEFSTKVLSMMIWVPGSTNLADCGISLEVL